MFELSVVARTLGDMTELTDEHREILAFERSWWKYQGAKETEVRRRFGMTSTRYYQVLNWLIDQSEALELDPMLVRRLRRIRAQRGAARDARRRGHEIG